MMSELIRNNLGLKLNLFVFPVLFQDTRTTMEAMVTMKIVVAEVETLEVKIIVTDKDTGLYATNGRPIGE